MQKVHHAGEAKIETFGPQAGSIFLIRALSIV
jgi:hypothetical protein